MKTLAHIVVVLSRRQEYISVFRRSPLEDTVVLVHTNPHRKAPLISLGF